MRVIGSAWVTSTRFWKSIFYLRCGDIKIPFSIRRLSFRESLWEMAIDTSRVKIVEYVKFEMETFQFVTYNVKIPMQCSIATFFIVFCGSKLTKKVR